MTEILLQHVKTLNYLPRVCWIVTSSSLRMSTSLVRAMPTVTSSPNIAIFTGVRIIRYVWDRSRYMVRGVSIRILCKMGVVYRRDRANYPVVGIDFSCEICFWLSDRLSGGIHSDDGRFRVNNCTQTHETRLYQDAFFTIIFHDKLILDYRKVKHLHKGIT